MTRKSRRELERELEDLNPHGDYDGPEEIVIRREDVGTEWEGSDLSPGERRVSSKRIYREGGEWNVEELDADDVEGGSAR